MTPLCKTHFFLPLFLFLFLFLLVPYVHANNIVTVFNLSPNNIILEVWSGFNHDAIGNSSFGDGKFTLWINDTSGGWGLAKIARGLMPHYWGLRYALLDYEFELRKQDNPTVNLEIDLKLVNYSYYQEINSTINVALVLFFDGYITDYQEHCYQTEIQFFSLEDGNIISNIERPLTWRNDSVSQFKLADHLELGIFKSYSINLTPYIKKMMNTYSLDQVKLKHVEISVEACRGYGKFDIYSAKITFQNGTTPNLVLAFLPLILVVAAISILKGMMK